MLIILLATVNLQYLGRVKWNIGRQNHGTNTTVSSDGWRSNICEINAFSDELKS